MQQREAPGCTGQSAAYKPLPSARHAAVANRRRPARPARPEHFDDPEGDLLGDEPRSFTVGTIDPFGLVFLRASTLDFGCLLSLPTVGSDTDVS